MPRPPLDSLPGIVPVPWDRLSLGPFLARSLLAGVTHLETLTLLSPASERPGFAGAQAVVRAVYGRAAI